MVRKIDVVKLIIFTFPDGSGSPHTHVNDAQCLPTRAQSCHSFMFSPLISTMCCPRRKSLSLRQQNQALNLVFAVPNLIMNCARITRLACLKLAATQHNSMVNIFVHLNDVNAPALRNPITYIRPILNCSSTNFLIKASLVPAL